MDHFYVVFTSLLLIWLIIPSKGTGSKKIVPIRSTGSITGSFDHCQPCRMAISTIHPLTGQRLTILPQGKGASRFAGYPHEKALHFLEVSSGPFETNCPDQPKNPMSSLEGTTTAQGSKPQEVPIETSPVGYQELTKNEVC